MLDEIKIIYKPVKNITLKVKPTLEVILTVPINIKQYEIDKVLEKRHDWIIKQLEFFKKFIPSKKEFVSGESFAYLGQSYRLKISQADTESILLSDEVLYVNLKDKTDEQKKQQLIDRWYKEKAEVYFKNLIDKYITIVNKPVNKITIRKMTTRWGSCNPKKAYINLNLELMKKHPSAIEYVVFHELTHLIHYHHDHNFYNYIATYMPDWKMRKERLLHVL
ncbi:MAG: SprT family zinc-dependent metalloprotease [Burkholderiales bacterium]|nr:SprT family zinc-dependent metalloprotease [Burkholderiales bacterium]